MSKAGARYVLSPDIEIQELWDSGAIATNVETGEAFKLNQSAAEIIDHLQGRAEFGAVVAALLRKYSVDRTTLERELQAAVAELLSKGIIVRRGADR